MFSLPAANWWRLLAWLALGFVIYFAYGRRHSVMHAARMSETPAQEPPTRLPISEES